MRTKDLHIFTLHFASHNKNLYKQVMSPSSSGSGSDADFAFNMDAAPATSSRIDNFDGTNYHNWKFKKCRWCCRRGGFWEVTSGEIKLEHLTTHCAGPVSVKSQVAQGAGDHLSCYKRIAATDGPFGDWSVRCMVTTRRALQKEESGEQALSSSTLLHDDDG